MKIQDNDAFYEFIKRYDPDDEYHPVGEVLYYLLRGDKPYEGVSSHREALRFVFDLPVKDSIEDKEKARMTFGDEFADKLLPLVCDVDKAKPSPLDPQVFFYCPNIVRTDHYGNAFYDAAWVPNDENFGTTVPYWYALMEPIHGRRNKPEDFKKVNEVLFPNGEDRERLDALCLTVYDKTLGRFVVITAAAELSEPEKAAPGGGGKTAGTGEEKTSDPGRFYDMTDRKESRRDRL